MLVVREICQSCGMTNEVVSRQFCESVPRCEGCGKPLRPPPTTVPVGAGVGGTLQLRMVPGRGLGVFSSVAISKGNLVERCPVFVFDQIPESAKALRMQPYSDTEYHIKLGYLLLPWIGKERAMALGYAMLYNHEPVKRSNVRYESYIDPDSNRRFIDFYAKRDIVAGEELTQTYTDTNRLWFTYKPPVGDNTDG